MTRGDVFRVRLPRGRGHAKPGPRYAVIVQADEFMPLSTAIVAPTSTSALPTSFRPAVEIAGEATRVLIEQLTTVDVAVLREHVGHLTAAEQSAVDEGLGLVLGLA